MHREISYHSIPQYSGQSSGTCVNAPLSLSIHLEVNEKQNFYFPTLPSVSVFLLCDAPMIR